MIIYIFILALILSLVLFYDLKGKSKNKGLWYNIVLLILILVAGLRWRVMIDTPEYIDSFYHEYPSLSEFSFSDYPIGKDPLYVLINSIVISLGWRFYIVQLIEATIVNLLIFNYFKRHSKYTYTCIFFYVLTCYVGYSMEIMRAGISIAICLYVNDSLYKKQWLKGGFLLFIALLFHIQSVVMAILPLCLFIRFNKLGTLILLFSYLIGWYIQDFYGDILNFIEFGDDMQALGDKVNYYTTSDDYSKQTGNINFVIVKIFPNLVFSLFSLFFLKSYSPHALIGKEPFVMLGIICIVLQMNIQICYRFVDYFRIYFVLIYAEVFVGLVNLYRQKLTYAYLVSLLVFLPYFTLISYSWYITSYAIYPYTSVFNRTINSDREKMYMNAGRPKANINEY